MGVEGRAAEQVWSEINRLVCAFHTQQAIDEHIQGDKNITAEDKVRVAAAWRTLYYWNSQENVGDALWGEFLGAVGTFLKDEAVVRHASTLVPYLRTTYGLPAYQPDPGQPFVAGITGEDTPGGAARLVRLKATARAVFMCFRKELVVGDRCVLRVMQCLSGYDRGCGVVDRARCMHPAQPFSFPHAPKTTGATRPTTSARAPTASSSAPNR
jgi:hypothetical protein